MLRTNCETLHLLIKIQIITPVPWSVFSPWGFGNHVPGSEFDKKKTENGS